MRDTNQLHAEDAVDDHRERDEHHRGADEPSRDTRDHRARRTRRLAGEQCHRDGDDCERDEPAEARVERGSRSRRGPRPPTAVPGASNGTARGTIASGTRDGVALPRVAQQEEMVAAASNVNAGTSNTIPAAISLASGAMCR